MKCLIQELNTAIDKYQNPNFLIMNQHTAYNMWRDGELQENWNEKGVSYSEYHNIPIAICERLIDGEVYII